MVLGAALVLAALLLLLWNRQNDQEAGASAESVLPQIVRQIQPSEGDEPSAPTYPDPYDPTMTEVEIDGYAYIGFLSMPSIQRELPVMAEWDYDRLKIAPCRYTGSTKTDDLVICAHNFDKHFGPLRKLVPGDEVTFTDMDGTTWHYQVSAVDVLAPEDISEMTTGGYALTLFTCTYGGASRVTIRCDRAEETGS